jgi:hypothetical protein
MTCGRACRWCPRSSPGPWAGTATWAARSPSPGQQKYLSLFSKYDEKDCCAFVSLAISGLDWKDQWQKKNCWWFKNFLLQLQFLIVVNIKSIATTKLYLECLIIAGNTLGTGPRSFPCYLLAGCFFPQIFCLHTAIENFWIHNKKWAQYCRSPLLFLPFLKCLYYSESITLIVSNTIGAFSKGSPIPIRHWPKILQQAVSVPSLSPINGHFSLEIPFSRLCF